MLRIPYNPKKYDGKATQTTAKARQQNSDTREERRFPCGFIV
ncbi:MAG: hypothetical protein ANABAC_0716 [Anaerolineae bacterium]|nr:MAG: hypothetical protein ANABAC_0716 [Anaerolineae bacterium]